MVPPQNSHSGGSASSQSSSPTHAGGWTHTGEWTRDTCGQADTQHTWAGGHTWTRVGKWTHADTRGQVDTRGHAWAGEHVDTHRAASSPGPQSPLQLRQVGLKGLAALPNALRRPGRTHKVTVCHFGSRWDVVQDQACVYFPQEEVHFTRMYANVCILTHRSHRQTHTHMRTNRCKRSSVAPFSQIQARRASRRGSLQHLEGTERALCTPRAGQASKHSPPPHVPRAEPGGQAPCTPLEVARPGLCPAAHPGPQPLLKHTSARVCPSLFWKAKNRTKAQKINTCREKVSSEGEAAEGISGKGTRDGGGGPSPHPRPGATPRGKERRALRWVGSSHRVS